MSKHSFILWFILLFSSELVNFLINEKNGFKLRSYNYTFTHTHTHTHICIYIYIYIYILYVYMSSSYAKSTHTYSLSLSLFLSIRRYCPLLLTSRLSCMLYPHRANKSNSLQVSQHWHVHMKESTRKRCAYVRPCFSSNTPHVLFVLLEWFIRWEASGRRAVVLWIFSSRICIYLEYLYSSIDEA